MTKNLLLVDDDDQSLTSTQRILELAGYCVFTATHGQEALAWVRERMKTQGADYVIVSDVRMPKLSGLEFIKALAICGTDVPVILMTAYGTVEDAVWAMKLGAVDFLTKPFKRQTLLDALDGAFRRLQNKRPETQASSSAQSVHWNGSSLVIQKLNQWIEQIAPTSASVLITGESGVGKEKLAQLIHAKSSRKNAPFIAWNCTATPENLIESELFGYEKGAFTGAYQTKHGLFEAADGGTLMLDEIGDMPLQLQSKLLRVLQEGEIRRLGSTQSHKINVRVLAATHRDLKNLVAQGAFREDLLYRLEVIHIEVPPLRKRAEDIPDLVNQFLSKFSAQHEKTIHSVASQAMEKLIHYSWPGNVRELSNVIERAVVLTEAEEIRLIDLPQHLQSATLLNRDPKGSITVPLGTSLDEIEKLLIEKTLEVTDGDKKMTAQLLGINSRTIYRKLDRKRT